MKPRLILPFLIPAALLAGCGRGEPARDARIQSLVTVEAAAVESLEMPVTQAVHGTVRPLARARVSSRINATIAWADFAIGQDVDAGDILVRLSAAEIDSRVDQARTRLEQATRDHAREVSLLERGATTREMARALEERRAIAEGELAEARAMLDYTEIRAPFRGVVTQKFIHAGDLATPARPLFVIEGADRFQAEFAVPESLPRLEPGAKLRLWSGETSVIATLAEISPAAAPGTRTRLAKIDLPDARAFRSGEFVRVEWPAGESRMLTVPASAVSRFGQMERVFVIRDGVARLRLVKTGITMGDRAQILAGLDAGETVIVAGPRALADGQPVEIAP